VFLFTLYLIFFLEQAGGQVSGILV